MKSNALKMALVLIMSINSFAQKQELGKVTIDELKEKRNPNDTSAVATILFEKGKVYFDYSQSTGFTLRTDVEAKIKIYKKEGYDWANKAIQIYVGDNNKEGIVFNKAFTYNLVNGAIEKTKLKSDGEFTEKINKLWDVKKVTMPNVKEGSIIEYSYTIVSPYFSNLIDWDFQKSIPVLYSEFKTNIPEYYSYNPHLKGFLTPVVTKNSNNRTLILTYNVRSSAKLTKSFKSETYNETVDFVEDQISYTLSNVPAVKDEAFVNNINNYSSSISHELVSIQMPQQPTKVYSQNWDDVAKTIYDNEDFGDQLNKSNYYENDVNALVSGITDINEKIGIVFNYVKSRMNWNKYYGIYCSDGVKKAYQDKIGNTAEINLMLVSMLRYAGLDANPILVSTRSNGISIYPTRTAFNTIIAGVKNGDALILMDATDKISTPDVLPIRDLNWFGRLIKKNGTSEMINLMPTENSADISGVMLNLDDKGVFSGKIRKQYSKYYALKFREIKNELSNDDYLQKIEKENNFEVSDYELTNEDLNEPVVEKYSVIANSSVDIIGDKMYFSPLLFLASKENPFKQEIREYPVDFSFPLRNKYQINITIPDGYKVENLPKPMAIAMAKNYGSYKFSIANVTPNVIQITAILDVNSPIIPSEDYSFLKEFFKMMIDKENEKIVLKKV